MKKCILFACSLLMLAGCAKNEIFIYGSSPEQGDSDSGSTNDDGYLVTFSASIENRKVSRAMSPMPKGLVSEIYAYKATDRRLGTPFEDGLYVTSSAGMLTGARGYKMYLPNDTYNMYAVSNNSTGVPPLFTDGLSAPLKNGVDYLWWENLSQDITISQIQVPVVFQHVATQVVIEISAGEGLQLDSLVSATILPPTPGQRLDLLTGIIEPAFDYDTTPVNMGTNGLLAQYIILPVQVDDPMALTLQVLADGEKIPRIYKASIPIAGKLAGGFSYVYSAIIDGNSVSFPSVSIKDWTEIDETGNPLYPTQK